METSVDLHVGVEDVKQVAEELQRDFEGTCVAIASDLAACDDPTHWLDVLTALGSPNDGLSAELSVRLETDFSPQVVQLLLGKSFDLSAVERVNEFLQWTLVAVGKGFRRADTCRLSCLARVLDAHRRFYLYHGTSNDGSGLNQGEDTDSSEQDEIQQSELRFTVRDKSEYMSRYFMGNLEFWGKLGGFSLLLDVLQAGGSPFEVLQFILRTLYDVKDHLRPEFIAQYFPKLADAVRTFIRKLESAEFYSLSRDSLLEVVQVLELLLVKILHDVDATERNEPVTKTENRKDVTAESDCNDLFVREVCEQRVQLLRLEISLRFFQSSSLERRIYGLTEIVVIITRLYNDQIQEQPEPTATSLYATLSYLVDWMNETKLMLELLGEKMHVELIKRSTSLFQFASELECLPTEWIDLVWSCYHADTDSVGTEQESRPVQRRHEAFRSTIHDLLLEMVTFMELPSLNHLVRRIEAVKAKLDSNQLGLFAAIAARTLLADVPSELAKVASSQRSLRQRILMHLWSVVLPSVMSDDFRDEVLLRMHEMLRLEVIGKDGGENGEDVALSKSCVMIDELLGLCLNNIHRRENLAISLKLFTQLSSLVAEVGVGVTAPRLINKAYAHIVLNEIVRYKQEMREALQGSEWLKMDDEERAKLPILKGHVSSIKNRLLALRASWILDQCVGAKEPSLSERQVDSVWQLMIVDAFLLDEAALCFQWIELCMNTPLQATASGAKTEGECYPRGLMPLDMAEYLLTTKFPPLSGDCITLSTLCCFHSIFRRINLVKGGLEVFAAPTPAGDSSLLPSPNGEARSGSSSNDEKDESVELMTGHPLVGLDELWQLAVRASNAMVAEEIITLLANFHLAFAPNVRHTELPLQRKMLFVEKCMGFIATAKSDAEMIRALMFSTAAGLPEGTDTAKLDRNVAVVNRCVDLLRYFLEACKIGDDSTEKEDEDVMMGKLQRKGSSVSTGASSDNGKHSKKAFRIDHLEERLPYLETYPSPMKPVEVQSDPLSGAKLGYRAARRPSWTFRQQHALLDVIVDTNEEVDTEDTKPTEIPAFRRDEELLRRSLESPASRHSDSECSPLKPDPRADLLKAGSPIKSSMRSPYMRANLRWPQAPSPQRGPDLRSEDVDQALTDFTTGSSRELYSKDEYSASKNVQNESSKTKARYGIMSQILANQGSHFDVLLELVDWGETTSQRTWDLLCHLPTNNELLRKMIHLRRADKDAGISGDVDWSDLLDGSSTQRLLYALRLVEALLIPIETVGSGDEELDSGRRQWRERFVRLGGARHLYETLLRWPQEHSPDASSDGDSILSQYAQNLRATCLAVVMRVLNYFFHWNRLSTTQQSKLSPFDLRLQDSTLPEFFKSIELSAMLQVAVELTGRCTSFSEESAEAVYCGVQMCCSLIRFSPHLTATVFEPLSDDEDTPNEGCRMTMSGWLKSLLIDCSSKSSRAQVLGVLSEMAMAFGVMDRCSPAREPFEPLVVSACDLVSGDLSETYRDVDLEELFSFCRVLLRSCGHLRTYKLLSAEDNNEANETLAAALIRNRIPNRLVCNLGLLVSKRQVSSISMSTRVSRSHEESILSGYLQILALLATISEKLRATILLSSTNDANSEEFADNSEQMILFVHDRLLFGDAFSDLDLPNAPVCKTSSTRDLAQRLLLNLVFPQSLERDNSRRTEDMSRLNHNALTLLNNLRGYQDSVLETINLAGRQWNNSPADAFLDAEKSTHHAGLVNPGCICYMNALVQQLFMTPSFSEGLLALDCSQIAANGSTASWRGEVEQLQKLFVSLAFTNYRSCDPTTFALSHKDMDGNSTDMQLQMDADEFFCLLLDRIEMFIRPKSKTDAAATSEDVTLDGDKDFLARCFDGDLVNQILTQQGNLSEREEKFFALSLEVSKKRHLSESLELYVQGESLEGENAYFCEREQRKVSATKRVCIKKLPQTLVCHLKRFEFDYDTMEKMKINDFLEFPMELDMFPYTSEALAPTDANGDKNDKSMMYDLVGVVVHAGTSDTGHYYSFIKDRHETKSQRWLEFNDEIVREFDVDTMGEECFGGEEVTQKWDSIQGTYSPIVQMKRRSAYMLIYERRKLEEAAHLPDIGASLALSSKVQALATQIVQENARYEGVVNVFDTTYEQFVRTLIGNVTQLPAECNPVVIRQAYQLGCQFLFGISSLRCLTSVSLTSSPVAASEKGSSHRRVSAHIALWLSDYEKSPCSAANDERRQFAQWILAEAVASPTTSLTQSASTASHHVESQRTWLFDVLFLSHESPELADSFLTVLSAAVSVLVREAAAEDTDAEESLVAFFRELLNMFYVREEQIEVSDPASGCVLTVSLDARVTATKQLGTFLEKCIKDSTRDATVTCTMTAERLVVRRLFLVHLEFLNRFLLMLQTPLEVSDIIASATSSQLSARGVAPLAIETRAATATRDYDLRLCTVQLETTLLRHLLASYDEPEHLVVDSTLLMNHAALKNVVLLGVADVFVLMLAVIVFKSESPSAKCDRLVALLVGVLEEVKDTHAEKVLDVFGGILDSEDVQTQSVEEADNRSSGAWSAYHHVFSPSRGLLESAVYYRDHQGSQDYTLLLLEFIVRRASNSSILQELFRSDPQFCSHVSWIPGWLVDHLDGNGTIRAQMKAPCSEEAPSTRNAEVVKLLAEIGLAFGVAVPAFCENADHGQHDEEQLLISPPSSPPAVAAEDVLLEALDREKENQHEVTKRGSGGSRWLGKSTGHEVGPEHEGSEVATREGSKPDWKMHRSREELAMLLRIDLDTTHNNAREA